MTKQRLHWTTEVVIEAILWDLNYMGQGDQEAPYNEYCYVGILSSATGFTIEAVREAIIALCEDGVINPVMYDGQCIAYRLTGE